MVGDLDVRDSNVSRPGCRTAARDPHQQRGGESDCSGENRSGRCQRFLISSQEIHPDEALDPGPVFHNAWRPGTIGPQFLRRSYSADRSIPTSPNAADRTNGARNRRGDAPTRVAGPRRGRPQQRPGGCRRRARRARARARRERSERGGASAQQRVHADALASARGRTSSVPRTSAQTSVRLCRLPERDLPPEAVVPHRQRLERRAGERPRTPARAGRRASPPRPRRRARGGRAAAGRLPARRAPGCGPRAPARRRGRSARRGRPTRSGVRGALEGLVDRPAEAVLLLVNG